MSQEFELPVKKVEGESLQEKLPENAYNKILPARYLLKDKEGNVTEKPEEMFERVAKNVAKPDKQYEGYSYEESVNEFYDLMTNLKFMPNSPTLMNAGADLQQLSACFVVHPEDDLDSIFGAVKKAAKIFQTGGGVGYPFHLLRPKGDSVKSTGGIASGPLTFQEVFDQMCKTIKQGGKRRGAQMAVMRVDHPDILRFIVSKRKEGKFSNFNISVGLTEDFMEAVKNDEEYVLINPRDGEAHEVTEQVASFYNSNEEWYPEAEGSDLGRDDNFWRDFSDEFENIDNFEIDLEPGEEMRIPARFIWNCIVDSAWGNGEPGLFMYDESNKKHSFDVDKHPEHRIESTNPCGEQPLENYEACNLGHINLSLLVDDKGESRSLKFKEWKEENKADYDFDEELGQAMEDFLHEALDMEEFERVAKTAVRFLDNVIEMSDFPLESISQKVKEMRKIGLGLMGFAQMLVQLGIEYGSQNSIECSRQIQKIITRMSVEESNRMAKERGKFKEWENSKWANPTEHPEWFKKYSGGLDPGEWEDGLKLRNHNTTTIAPTGTTSMIAGTSGGCEPIYSLAYFKNVGKDVQGEDMLVEFDDYFLHTLETNGIDVEKVKEEAVKLMSENEWEGVESISDDVLPPEIKRLFVSADQVTPEQHVKIQAAFQEYNHSAISKTCNFPNEATREDVADAFMLAYELGVKGLTVYRDGSRDEQVMMTGKKEESKEDLLEKAIDGYGSVEDLLTSDAIKDELGIDGDSGILIKENGDFELEYKKVDPDVEKDNGKSPRNRPNIIHGSTQKINTGQGKMYVTINEDSDGIFELFATIGKSGGFTSSLTEAMGRLVSLALRSGIEPEEVIDELKGIRSPKMAHDRGSKIYSIPDGIGKALERYIDGEARNVQESVESFSDGGNEDSEENNGKSKEEIKQMIEHGRNPECPDCGSILKYTEGCVKCPSCGYSEC